MPKILLVEDDSTFADVIVDWLGGEKYVVDLVGNGKEALQHLRFNQYDLVILDWGLPDLDGVSVCKQFRSNGGLTPVLMLTGKREIDDKETGLDAGADDYLTKPFNMRELSARLRALLRRPQAILSKELRARDVVVDTVQHKVLKSGKEIDLLPKEFDLLTFLMCHPGQVFSPDALLDRIWPTESDASKGAIRTYVNRIRGKIDVQGEPSMISNVHGVGYRFDPDP